MTMGGCMPARGYPMALPCDAAGGGRSDGGRRVVIAGGGTGGHLFPGIAVAEEFRIRSELNRVLFISRGNAFERAALARAGFPLETITVEGLKGRGGWNQLRVIARLPWSILQSILRLRAFQPDLVLGLGSYSAGPVVMAAWLLRIPVALCEQNTWPGITNRVLARLADRIFTSFAQTAGGFQPAKVRWTGNPLRREIVQSVGRSAPRGAAPAKPFTVLVIGGSQGAHRINAAVSEALDYLGRRSRFFFIHQTGRADEPMVAEAYRRSGVAARVQPFFEDMAAQYGSADLIICRAGATTVAEVTALGKAAVFIPYPYAADDHQRRNARHVVDAGAAEMIDEGQLDGRRLSERLLFFASHPEALARLEREAARLGKPDAAQAVVNECCRLMQYRATGDRAAGQRVNGPTG